MIPKWHNKGEVFVRPQRMRIMMILFAMWDEGIPGVVLRNDVKRGNHYVNSVRRGSPIPDKYSVVLKELVPYILPHRFMFGHVSGPASFPYEVEGVRLETMGPQFGYANQLIEKLDDE